MNKKFLIPLLAVFVIAGVFAGGYVVKNFVIQTDVLEPFSVQYSIIGQASNWDGVTGCDAEGLIWTDIPESTLDVGGLFAGEGRAVCFKIHNEAEADIGYTISNVILNEDGATYNKCLNAFGLHTLSGTALKSVDTTTGVGVVVAGNSSPVNDCVVKIEVARG